jgi:hypothetical protein
MRAHKKKTTVFLAAVVLLLGAGGAFAYWLSSGHGAGAGTTGHATDFTVAGDGVTAGDALTPGGPSQTVGFTVTNPSTGHQYLHSVTASVANADGTLWDDVDGCSADDYTVGTPTITPGDMAGGATRSGTVVVSMNNLTTDQSACQDLAYPLYFTAS